MKNLESEKEATVDFKVYQAVEISEERPVKGDDNREYIVVGFEEKADDGVLEHCRIINKVLFEDTHSRIYKAAQEARDNGTPGQLKVRANFTHPECQPYYVVIDGKRQTRADGELVVAEIVTLFLIKDEKFITEYKRALRRLDFVDVTGDGTAAEEAKAETLSK